MCTPASTRPAGAYPPILKVSEVAALLRRPKSKIRKLCQSGEIDARKLGRDWEIYGSWLADFLRESA